MVRPSREVCFMRTAMIWAERATCPRGKVGSLLIRNNRIISIGYCASPPGESHCTEVGCLIEDPKEGCIRTVHSEINAILFAAREGIKTEGSIMYVTLSPCFRCSQVILSAGIVRVVYLDEYRDLRGVEFLRKRGVEVLKFVEGEL